MSDRSSTKRLRILTNRAFPAGGFEFIEMEERDERQFFYWRAGEDGMECCFPVPLDFVKEKFEECGRTYRVSGKEAYRTSQDIMHHA